jgi:hypothetical protein
MQLYDIVSLKSVKTSGTSSSSYIKNLNLWQGCHAGPTFHPQATCTLAYIETRSGTNLVNELRAVT